MAFLLFFFNDTATTEIYTLSLHDALPISSVPSQSKMTARTERRRGRRRSTRPTKALATRAVPGVDRPRDRKSTRLNSSHLVISYAVFCLKKKINRAN